MAPGGAKGKGKGKVREKVDASHLPVRPWAKSTVTPGQLSKLVSRGLLASLTPEQEWMVPGDEVEPAPRDGYVVSFLAFHERGFGMPAHPFLRGLLHHYGAELQHLNPNGVQRVAAFVALCEGYLGVEPHFGLWKHFFEARLETPMVGRVRMLPPMGSVGLYLRTYRSSGYLKMPSTSSNSGWHDGWFYLKNSPAGRLPEWTGRLIKEEGWQWDIGPSESNKEKKKTEGLVSAVELLVSRGVTGVGVIGAYHRRRVLPLAARQPPLYEMGSLGGAELGDDEVLKRLKAALDGKDLVYPVPGHPPMRPEPGFVDVSGEGPFYPFPAPVPEDAERRRLNREADAAAKIKKDSRKKRRKERKARNEKLRAGGLSSEADSDSNEEGSGEGGHSPLEVWDPPARNSPPPIEDEGGSSALPPPPPLLPGTVPIRAVDLVRREEPSKKRRLETEGAAGSAAAPAPKKIRAGR